MGSPGGPYEAQQFICRDSTCPSHIYIQKNRPVDMTRLARSRLPIKLFHTEMKVSSCIVCEIVYVRLFTEEEDNGEIGVLAM